MNAVNFIIPAIIALICIYGLIKKVNVFEAFVEGAKEGISVVAKIAPVVIGLVTAISMFKASGGLEFIVMMLTPAAQLLNFPREVLPLAVMRPVSGSGAIALLNNMLKNYGPDTFSGRVASVLAASTETTLYTIGVYMGSAGIKKTKATLPASLFAEFCAIIMAVLSVRLIFK